MKSAVGTRFTTLATTATIALLTLGGTTSELQAQSCKDAGLGYPVVASSPDSLHPSFLAAMADAAAYRWRVPTGPSSASGSPAGRVAARLRTPVPIWDEQWQPKKKHRAMMTVVMNRYGTVTRSRALVASGDGKFDRSIEAILDDPMPGAPQFPRLPDSYAGDSAVITLSFGDDEAARVPGVGVMRFAAQQRPPNARLATHAWPISGTGTQRGAARQSATVKFDLTAEGAVIPGSIEVLESTDGDLKSRVERYVSGLEYVPGEANCRPIAQTMVRTFKN